MKKNTVKKNSINAERANESYNRCRTEYSELNDNIVISTFEERGIEDAEPRVNVFTFNIWKYKFNRIVIKGEKGVKIGTFFKSEDDDGKVKRYRKSASVFHISQTEKLKGGK